MGYWLPESQVCGHRAGAEPGRGRHATPRAGIRPWGSARRWAPAPAAPAGNAIPRSSLRGLPLPSFPPWNRPFTSVRFLRPSLNCGDNPEMESKALALAKFSTHGSQAKTTNKGPASGVPGDSGVVRGVRCQPCRLQSFSKNLRDLIVLVFTGDGSSQKLRLQKGRNGNWTPAGCTTEFKPFTTSEFGRQEVFRFSGAPPTWLLFHSFKQKPGGIATQSELVWPWPALYSLGNPGGLCSFYPVTVRFIINQARSCKMNFSSVSSSKRD